MFSKTGCLKISAILLLPCFAGSAWSQSTQVTVLRYDTVVTVDPDETAARHLMIYNRNSGKLIRAGKLVNGRREGIWRSYYENGMISKVEEYKNDALSGTVISIETNGVVSKEENVLHGVKNGLSREYNRTGTLKLEEHYTQGQLSGWRRVFGSDGKLQEEGNWKNGARDSINRWAYPGGNIYVEYFYRNGAINGPCKTYYESGNLKSEGTIVNNYEEGGWKEYSDSTKKIIAQGHYLAGKKTGTWKYFNSDGSPHKTEDYDAAGTLVKETLHAPSAKKK
jgi:antitoxin component YwqK of YwqJK toxin-antitoxin module